MLDAHCAGETGSGRDAGIPRRPRPAARHRDVIAAHDRAAPSRQRRTARPFQGDRHALRRRARQSRTPTSISRRRGGWAWAPVNAASPSRIPMSVSLPPTPPAPWPSWCPTFVPPSAGGARQVPDGRARPACGAKAAADRTLTSSPTKLGRWPEGPEGSWARPLSRKRPSMSGRCNASKMVFKNNLRPRKHVVVPEAQTREIRWIGERNPDARHSLIARHAGFPSNSTMTKASTQAKSQM